MKPRAKGTPTFCYVDHSKPVGHPYHLDHMNAHLRTDDCERREARARKRAPKGAKG